MTIFTINTDNIKRVATRYAPLLLRVSLAIVFLYFGISQLRHPESFIGWLPSEVQNLPLSPRTFVVLNGGFEVFFGTLMLVGLFTRISALLLGGHLMGIFFTIGWTEIGVRDFGLALATLTIVLLGAGPWSLENLLRDLRGERASTADESDE